MSTTEQSRPRGAAPRWLRLCHRLTVFRRAWRAYGLCGALRVCAFSALRRVITFHALRGMYVTDVASHFTEPPDGMTATFLDRERLHRIAQDLTYELPSNFLNDALSKGDECYGVLAGDTLVAYGWYARSPTRINAELRVQFDKAYVYMYKGLTLEAYRGLRLHAIAKTRALAAYRERGFKGLVSYVAEDNVCSLKSAHRMGYVDFGRIVVLRLFGHYFVFRTPGCAKFGFNVVPIRRAELRVQPDGLERQAMAPTPS